MRNVVTLSGRNQNDPLSGVFVISEVHGLRIPQQLRSLPAHLVVSGIVKVRQYAVCFPLRELGLSQHRG